MGLSRRNVLVGLGTALAGAGAAIGTGAFSSVSATRTVNVSVAGDGGGFLTLAAENEDYVDVPSGQAMVINLDGSGGNGSASGLNVDAVTTIDPLFSATNNGSDGIGFSVTADTSDADISISSNTIENSVGGGNIKFTFYDTDESNNPSIVSNPRDIGTGNTMNVGLEIDTTGISDASNITNSNLLSAITLNAETSAFSGT